MNILLYLSAISHSISITFTQGFLIIFTCLLFWKAFKKEINLFDCPFTKYYMFLLFTGFLSVIFGINPKRSIASFRDEWLLFYFFVGYFFVKKDNISKIFLFLLIGGIIASSYSFYQFFIKHYERAQGFYSHALTFGNVLSILTILFISALIVKIYKNKNEFFMYTFSIILFFLAIYLSGGRAAFIFTVLSSCFLLVLAKGKKGIYFSLIIIFVFFIVGYFVYKNPTLNRRINELANESINNSMSSIGTRIALWKASFNIFLDYPIFGIGYGNFKGIIKNYLNVPVLTTAHAHNAYIQYIVLHGLVGFASLIIFLYKILIGLVENFKKNKPMATIGLAVMLLFLLQGLLENNFYDSEVAMVFWFILGAILGSIKKP